MTTLHPGGANGVASKLNIPFNAVYAEIFWLRRDGRNIFNVITDCGISLSHKCMGKLGFTVHNPEMKWFFHVLMARSAAFLRCEFGGTN